MTGDDNAERFLSLLNPIERELEVYCRRLLWNRDDAPDALQNAVMRAFGAFDRYHDDGSFRAWMFKILTNEVFALNRKHGRVAEHEFQVEPEELDALAALEDAAAGTDWLLSPDALRDLLDQDLVAALKTLTDNERAVLLQRAIGQFRYHEIAQSLDMPLGSVMGHLARARKKMRAALRRKEARP
ncbi:MAG: RNA polymerase sigma factor [Verrucomicrobiota bacterium]